MKQTAVEWLMRMLEGQKNEPFNYDEWQIAFEHAKEMEKLNIIDFADEYGTYLLQGGSMSATTYNATFKNKTDEKDNNTDNNSNSRLHL